MSHSKEYYEWNINNILPLQGCCKENMKGCSTDQGRMIGKVYTTYNIFSVNAVSDEAAVTEDGIIRYWKRLYTSANIDRFSKFFHHLTQQ